MTKPDDTVLVRLSVEDANRLPTMLWAVLDAIDGEELPDGTMDALDRLALTIHNTTKDLHNERAR